MSNRIEKVTDNSFMVTVASTDGELVHPNNQPAPAIIQSILNRYGMQVAEGMSVSILINVIQDGNVVNIIADSGEIIEMHEAQNGPSPMGTGTMLTDDELDAIMDEYDDDIMEVFELYSDDDHYLDDDNDDYDRDRESDM